MAHSHEDTRPPVLVLGKPEWTHHFESANQDPQPFFRFVVAEVEDENRTLERVRSLFRNNPASFVLPFYEEYTEAARQALSVSPQFQSRVIAPPDWVFKTFEGRYTGKALTRKWMIGHGLKRNTLREYSRDRLWEVQLPAVVKPAQGTWGAGIRIVKTREELRAAVSAVLDQKDNRWLRKEGNSTVIIQEAVLGTSEWGVYFIASEGTLLRTLCVKYTFDDDLFVRKGGAASKGVAVRPCYESPFRVSSLRRIVSLTTYNGFGCLGLKERGADSPALFEINTRPCGWLVASGRFSRFGKNGEVLSETLEEKLHPLTNFMHAWLARHRSNERKKKMPQRQRGIQQGMRLSNQAAT